MSQTHHIIYIPGLGDQDKASFKNIFKASLQKKLINGWHNLDVAAHYFAVGWSDSEPFGQKLKRLTDLIDGLSGPGARVSLVGVSAGASLAFNGYVERRRKISGVVFVCGELGGSACVRPSYFKTNPAFKGSMKQLDTNLSRLNDTDRTKMLSIHPLYDEIVPIKDTKIAGVKNRRIISVEHALSIGLAMTIYKRIVINFLKQQSVQ
jgi:pimeloyl-ACP methyl ester carboxylesterase